MPIDQTPPDDPRPPGAEGTKPPPATPLGLPASPAAELDPSQLTPEEQMARFAKELKENDWGHQPC